MSLDLERLQKHYASLSDDALLEIDETELVEEAFNLYEAELEGRGLLLGEDEVEDEAIDAEEDGSAEETGLNKRHPSQGNRTQRYQASGDEADWVEHAAVAFAAPALDSDELIRAKEALDALGMPTHIRIQEADLDGRGGKFTELLVPGQWILDAVSLIDRDVLNERSEADWVGHFSTMSDEELEAVDPEILVAGMEDRARRLRRVYREAMAQRRGE